MSFDGARMNFVAQQQFAFTFTLNAHCDLPYLSLHVICDPGSLKQGTSTPSKLSGHGEQEADRSPPSEDFIDEDYDDADDVVTLLHTRGRAPFAAT